MTKSALYEGEVYHDRLVDGPRQFRYRLFLAYLDLEELPGLLRGNWLWSARRPSIAWFRRRDYFGSPDRPLREAVLDRVEEELGRRPEGAVRMLAHVRTLGYVFNPVSFYYCFDRDERLEAVVAEITNTPWRERHAYVLDARRGGEGELLEWTFRKDFHVSPFLDMEHDYVWRFGVPGDGLEVHMTNRAVGQDVFHAGISLRRRALTGRSLLGALLRYPLLPQRVHLAIYWQAFLLWLRKTTFYTHPEKRARETGATTR